MVGKINFPDGTVKVDWSTYKRDKRKEAFREALSRRQLEIKALFKIGIKVISRKHLIEIGFADLEVASKVGESEGLIRDDKNGHFVSSKQKTLVGLFNSGHEFIVISHSADTAELILNQDINFFTDDLCWYEYLKDKPCLALELTPVNDSVSSIHRGKTLRVFDIYLQTKQV